MTKPDHASILDAYDTEYAKRRKIWIAGIPEQADLRALRRAIARTLEVTEVDVDKAIELRRASVEVQ